MDQVNLTQMPDGWKEHTCIYIQLSKQMVRADVFQTMSDSSLSSERHDWTLGIHNLLSLEWHNWNLTQVALTLLIYHNQWEINQHYVCGFQVTGLVVKSLWHKASFGPEHTCNTVSHNAMCLTCMYCDGWTGYISHDISFLIWVILLRVIMLWQLVFFSKSKPIFIFNLKKKFFYYICILFLIYDSFYIISFIF